MLKRGMRIDSVRIVIPGYALVAELQSLRPEASRVVRVTFRVKVCADIYLTPWRFIGCNTCEPSVSFLSRCYNSESLTITSPRACGIIDAFS